MNEVKEVSEFETLSSLNINDKTEKKGRFTYLSWAWAWAEFVKVHPSATYEVIKNANGMPYFADATGGMVYTKVKAGNLIHEMWLPIMDQSNKAKKEFDAMDINKTVMRCLVKNLAMFGLGLYIYAGEDLPESEEKQEPKVLTPPRKINQIEGENIMELIGFTSSDIEKFCENFHVKKIGDLTLVDYQKGIKMLQVKKSKMEAINGTA